MRYTYLASMTLIVGVACARSERPADTSAPAAAASSPADDRARTAATIANAIAANPAAADSILTANNHTRDSFSRLMYDIAADSALSAVYAAAKTP